MTSASPLRVELRGSPALTTLTAAMHAAAAVCLLAVLPVLPALFCTILLGALGAVVVRESTLLRAPNAPAVLEGAEDGGLTLQLQNGTRLAGRASPRRYVNRWLVALDLHLPGGGGRMILVAGDMLGSADFRRLRLWALWNALPTPRGATGG